VAAALAQAQAALAAHDTLYARQLAAIRAGAERVREKLAVATAPPAAAQRPRGGSPEPAMGKGVTPAAARAAGHLTFLDAMQKVQEGLRGGR
jgi:hypothetical protein